MSIPLAERLRPRTLDDYIGQEHLVGGNGVFRKFLETGNVPSFILWGPPGVGKTTLAKIVATQLKRPFFTLSAVTSGVKDVREVIERAKSNRFFSQSSPILFIDEIHRFSKSQQDSLLVGVGLSFCWMYMVSPMMIGQTPISRKPGTGRCVITESVSGSGAERSLIQPTKGA